jgi:predicted metal-dependent peptidase
MYVHAVQEQLMTHVDAIMAQAKPSKLILADFDVGIKQVAEFDRGDDNIKLRPKGGGGTSFVELFQWLDQQDIAPAAVIVLTDMFGTFPPADPGYPVIWAATTDVKAPFGETIHVK